MDPQAVAVFKQDVAVYPERPPFHPPAIYPELGHLTETNHQNSVYTSVRNLFHLLGYDREHDGSPEWNPLGWLIKPGDTVFLKPNMIAHKHALNNDWDYVITHGSVIRATVDYVYLALRGKGKIIIGDGPQSDSHFEKIRTLLGLDAIRDLYAGKTGVEVDLLDLRDEHYVEKDGIYVDTVRLPGDPRGRTAVDLGTHSMFSELDGQGKRYYGAFYDWKETNAHHHTGKHEYAISRTPLSADVVINLPKLKTHKKCGLTVNIKSMVGINANKNWLPHYIFGSPENGGDQFDHATVRNRLENAVVMPAKTLLTKKVPLFRSFARKTKKVGYDVFGGTEEVVRSGNWHGNDTVWRMSIDLNRILLYANTDGSLRTGGAPKRFFSIVDGITAMEGNGPVAGTRREAGVLIAGMDPVAVDAVCATLMGYECRKLPLIHRAFEPHRFPLTGGSLGAIRPISNMTCWNLPLRSWRNADLLHFEPHFGWVGTIEREDPTEP
jgi:uncharacterized protein (DUF362 family)